MTPDQWDTNSPPSKFTDEDAWQHIVACFHFLLQKPGAVQQKYTAAELAVAIETSAFDANNPGIAWTLAFLRERADTFLTVRVSY